MNITEKMVILNGILSGADGKGWDCFPDLFGIDPEDFTRQRKKKKQQILRDIYGGFRNILWNYVKDFGLDGEEPNFEVDWWLLDWLIEMGTVAKILDDVTNYYSRKWKDWEWLKAGGVEDV